MRDVYVQPFKFSHGNKIYLISEQLRDEISNLKAVHPLSAFSIITHRTCLVNFIPEAAYLCYIFLYNNIPVRFEISTPTQL